MRSDDYWITGPQEKLYKQYIYYNFLTLQYKFCQYTVIFLISICFRIIAMVTITASWYDIEAAYSQ